MKALLIAFIAALSSLMCTKAYSTDDIEYIGQNYGEYDDQMSSIIEQELGRSDTLNPSKATKTKKSYRNKKRARVNRGPLSAQQIQEIKDRQEQASFQMNQLLKNYALVLGGFGLLIAIASAFFIFGQRKNEFKE